MSKKTVNVQSSLIGTIVNHVYPPEQCAKFLENNRLFDPVDSFKGRSTILEEIRNVFQSSNTRIVVIYGAPGMGKTETARYFAFQNKDIFQNVRWICADQKSDSTENDLVQIYGKFKSDPCLIIFDNAENMKSIQEYLPSTEHQHIKVLITSQYAVWDSPSVHKVYLKPLDIKEAVAIMQYIVPEYEFRKYKHIWEELAKLLECIPISLQIVSAILVLEFGKYRLRGEFDLEKFKDALKQDTSHFESACFPNSIQMNYQNTIMSSINLSLDRLKTCDHKLSLDVLYFMAYLDPDHIHVENLLLVPSLENCEKKLEEAINILNNYSLIKTEKKSSFIKVHRNVQLVLRQNDLNNNDGFMFKTLLHEIFVSKIKMPTRNLSSVFRYAQKEAFKEKCVEFYKEHEEESAALSFLNMLAYEHCDIPLKDILMHYKTKHYNTEQYNDVLNSLLIFALKHKNDNYFTIKLLVNYGAKLTSATEPFGWNTLHYLSLWKSIELLRLLLESNAPENIVNSRVANGKTLFHLLIRQCDENNVAEIIECLDYLIEKNADISATDFDGNNVIHTACLNSIPSLTLITHLIETYNCKYMVNEQNDDGETPLHRVYMKTQLSKKNKLELLSYLLKNCNGNIEIEDNHDKNSFFNICRFGSSDEIKFIFNEFDTTKLINKEDVYGNIAFAEIIHNAAITDEERKDLIQLFIDSEADHHKKLLNQESLC